MLDVPGTPYSYEDAQDPRFRELLNRVREMRTAGKLSPEVLYRIRRFFKIKNIYHSNAIEGNLLGVGETRQVVERGLTITGKPLKDQAEARNLSHALDFLEELAGNADRPILETDIRQIHSLVLKGIDDEPGAYRKVPVEISGSAYPPPGPEEVAVQMQEFGDWLGGTSTPGKNEDFSGMEGFLAAAAAHCWFVTIHPFIDGNGRVARLLMNLLLMRYGIPIAIISKEDRLRYYDTLETSQASDLTPFAVLLAECIEESLEEYEQAAEEQRQNVEWAESLAQKFTQQETTRARNEYEVWKNAMELFKSFLRQTSDILDETIGLARIYFKDFGDLEFEKYFSLRNGLSAKRTWFFRVDFRSGDRSARYLFFFGYGSPQLRASCNVTLHIAREEPANSYHYVRLDEITAPNVPNLVEVGYDMPKERFVIRRLNNRRTTKSIEEFGKAFFEDVVNKHFVT